MFRLFSILWSLAFFVLAGSAIVVVLTMGRFGTVPILIAAGLGAVVALPVAWVLARRLMSE
jgi:hypothetical protein